MTITLAVLVALFISSCGQVQPPPPAPPAPPAPKPASRLGIYHWGGVAAHGITEGVQRAVAMNAKVVRVTISPNYRTDYNVGIGCEDNYYLPRMLDKPDVHDAVFYPGLEAVLITAYDSSFKDCLVHNYFDPDWYTPSNHAAMVAEYAAFTEALLRGAVGLNRTFVLLNWEGDNAVYCGGSYAFSLSEEFRANCLAQYQQAYHNDSPAETLRGMNLWMRARHEGVRDGAARAGVTDSTVLTGLEISGTRHLRAAGFPTVLDAAIPGAPIDYVSYSAYESINMDNPGAQLTADLLDIELQSGKRVLVGEFGYNRTSWGEDVALAKTAEVVDAALASNAKWIIYWNLYDQEHEQLGLYDSAKQITSIGSFLVARLQTTR